MRIRNFEMFAGDHYTLKLTLMRDDIDAPHNLQGSTILWQLARNVDSPSLIQKATAGNGIEIANVLDGRCDVQLLTADTDNLAGQYYHEAKLITDDYVVTAITGTFSIKAVLKHRISPG
jgi:hypothetical protein